MVGSMMTMILSPMNGSSLHACSEDAESVFDVTSNSKSVRNCEEFCRDPADQIMSNDMFSNTSSLTELFGNSSSSGNSPTTTDSPLSFQNRIGSGLPGENSFTPSIKALSRVDKTPSRELVT